jgi:hypothetical protein
LTISRTLSSFSGCGKQFHEIAMRENGRGKEEKKDGLSTADQMKDRQKKPKQKLSQIESPIKHILSKKLSAQC